MLSTPNGNIFAFGKDVNIDWRHGIPQILKIKNMTKEEYLLLHGVG